MHSCLRRIPPVVLSEALFGEADDVYFATWRRRFYDVDCNLDALSYVPNQPSKIAFYEQVDDRPLAFARPVILNNFPLELIAVNDDWRSDGNANEVALLEQAPKHHNEAAVLRTLAPGPYSAHLSGTGGGRGAGIVACRGPAIRRRCLGLLVPGR